MKYFVQILIVGEKGDTWGCVSTHGAFHDRGEAFKAKESLEKRYPTQKFRVFHK